MGEKREDKTLTADLNVAGEGVNFSVTGTLTQNQLTPQSGPTIESVHRDIAFANSYRIELLKTLLAITTALFAFTVAFRPQLSRVDEAWAMWVGWGALAASMIGGLIHMIGWDHYYKSYRDFDWKLRDNDGAKRGNENRKCINLWRRSAMFVQYFGFAIGVAGVAYFAGANIDNAKKPETPHQQTKASVEPAKATPAVVSPQGITK